MAFRIPLLVMGMTGLVIGLVSLGGCSSCNEPSSASPPYESSSNTKTARTMRRVATDGGVDGGLDAATDARDAR